MADPIDLVVHAGPQLCGGTGIRAQLTESQSTLAEHGIYAAVPTPGSDGLIPDLAAELASDEPVQGGSPCWDRIIEEARAMGARAVVISCDELAAVLVRPHPRRRLRRRVVRPLRGKLRMVITMRDRLEHVNLTYATAVTDLRYRASFDELVDSWISRWASYTWTRPATAIADDALFVASDALERGNGLASILEHMSIPGGASLSEFEPDATPGVLDVQVGAIVQRVARARRRDISRLDRAKVFELTRALAESVENPAFWGWTSELLQQHVTAYALEAIAFAERVDAPVPPMTLRPTRRPSTAELPPTSVAMLVDRTGEIVEACDMAPPPHGDEVQRAQVSGMH